MAHRTVLTKRQRDALFTLPTDRASLEYHYTLADDDIAYIKTRRRPQNQIGFALQLCAFRYPGRFLKSSEVIPEAVSAYIAAQLGLKAEDLPDGQGWAVEQVTLSTHNGTHLDAPWHFHPTMNRGERSWTIDEVPPEWCFQSGVKLDFRHLPDGYVATAKDVEAELKRIGHELKPLEIVVVNTSAGAGTKPQPSASVRSQRLMRR